MKNWTRKPWIVLTTWFIFIFFMVVILPAVVLQTEAIGITESIDTNFGFQASEIYRIIGSYGVDGRSYYLLQRWTFDLVWPLAYGLPLFTTLRLFLPQVLNQRWGFIAKLPLLAVGLDYLENIIFSIIVIAYPNEFTWLAFLGVSVSLLKWLTLSAAMLLTVAISLWAFMKFLKTVLRKRKFTK